MRQICLKIRFMANVLFLILVLPAFASAEISFNQVISFGGSLSDPGNAFALTGEQTLPPYDSLDFFLIPNASYAKGGHHFSNGGTWIEQFAKSVGLAEDAKSAFLRAGTNYAVGGARAHDFEGRFNLSDQVSMFLADFDGVAPSDALYTLEFGGNDIRDALNNPADPTILLMALGKIAENIELLYTCGARKFLVWNSPDIGLTPALKIMDLVSPGASGLASGVSEDFNEELNISLNGLRLLHDDIEIVLFNSFDMMQDLVDYPNAYGLVNTEIACVQPNSPPFKCKKPDRYLFWDGIHPTKAAHSILAEFAIDLLMGP